MLMSIRCGSLDPGGRSGVEATVLVWWFMAMFARTNCEVAGLTLML